MNTRPPFEDEKWFTYKYFTNQYKVIMLLLHFGIDELPSEIVLKILREHVYVAPIRVGRMCYESLPCRHNVMLPGKYTVNNCGAMTIKKWFMDRGIDVPKHFDGSDDDDDL